MKKSARLLFLCGLLLAPRLAEARLWVSVDPNALQRREDSMRLTLRWPGAANGTRVQVQILRDCNGDGSPDVRAELCRGSGQPVLRQWESVLQGGQHEESVAMTGLPEQEPLWLRATAGGEDSDDALFFIAQDRCSVLQTVLSVFKRGECRIGVLDALEQLLGDVERPADALLEVRLLDPERPEAPPRILPGTRSATGVGWDGNDAVWVTLAGQGKTPAGLYRVRLRPTPGRPELVWTAPAGVTGLAPLGLTRGRALLVLQKDVIGADGVTGWIAQVEGRKLVKRAPLRRTVHALLAAQGDRVVFYSRWQGVPEFCIVHLTTGNEMKLGRDGALLYSLFQAPAGTKRPTVWAETDRANDTGWDLWILQDADHKARPLLRRVEHDLLPVWRPDGAQLAYLGEAPGR